MPDGRKASAVAPIARAAVPSARLMRSCNRSMSDDQRETGVREIRAGRQAEKAAQPTPPLVEQRRAVTHLV